VDAGRIQVAVNNSEADVGSAALLKVRGENLKSHCFSNNCFSLLNLVILS